jgi:DNA-binding GntR family transcriptional regulator
MELASNTSTSVTDTLRQQILDGELRPDALLDLSRLRGQTGARIPALCKALGLLEREGLVRAAGVGRRFEVSRLEPLDLAATYEVRELLDGLGARLAAISGLSALIEERFAEATAGMAQASGPTLDKSAFAQAHVAWHLALFDASGNACLRESSRLVRVTAHCLVWRSLPPSGQERYRATVREIADSTFDEHTRILRAIRAGDAAGAAHAAQRHIRRSTNYARVVGTGLRVPQVQSAV